MLNYICLRWVSSTIRRRKYVSILIGVHRISPVSIVVSKWNLWNIALAKYGIRRIELPYSNTISVLHKYTRDTYECKISCSIHIEWYWLMPITRYSHYHILNQTYLHRWSRHNFTVQFFVNIFKREPKSCNAYLCVTCWVLKVRKGWE